MYDVEDDDDDDEEEGGDTFVPPNPPPPPPTFPHPVLIRAMAAKRPEPETRGGMLTLTELKGMANLLAPFF